MTEQAKAVPSVEAALAYAEGFEAGLWQVKNTEVAGLVVEVNALTAQLAFERAQVTALEVSEAEAAKLIEIWMALEAKAWARVEELERTK
jgi:hypothetical protein